MAMAPTGDQYPIQGGGYRAVVTECGAALRSLEHRGRPLVDGFAEDETPSGGRGQLLVPWPNRIGDGRYDFGGRTHQLALSEPARRNASHGLVRWAAWTLEEHTEASVSLTYRLMAQSGYPWTVDLHALYDVSADGLTVTLTATNLSSERAPYAWGAHPYLVAGAGRVDDWELTLRAGRRLLVDPERKLPAGSEPVAGTDLDFSGGRTVGALVLDHAFGDLAHADGRVTVTVRDPATGRGVLLWGDEHTRWLQLYSGDDAPATARRSLAVEPMSSPPAAFASGEDLVVLAPAGEPGDEHSAGWGIRAIG